MSILFENFSFRFKPVKGGIYYDRWADDTLMRFEMQDRLCFLDKIINTILLHEIIYIRTDSLEEFIEVLGLEATIKLLDRQILKVIDYWYFPAFMVSGEDSYLFMCMERQNTHPNIIERLKQIYRPRQYSYIEDYLKNNLLQNQMYSYWDSLALDETRLNFSNKLLRAHLKLTSPNAITVNEDESFYFTRLFLMERSLQWSQNLNTDVVILEDRAKFWLSLKAGQPLNRNIIGDINKILSAKKIWNLSLLYYYKAITIDDILDVRDNVNGIKFREWIASKYYNIEELENVLMSHKIEDPQKKWIKWSIMNVIGIANAPIGVVVNFIDQLRGIKKEWTPELFFDITLTRKFAGRKINKALKK